MEVLPYKAKCEANRSKHAQHASLHPGSKEEIMHLVKTRTAVIKYITWSISQYRSFVYDP